MELPEERFQPDVRGSAKGECGTRARRHTAQRTGLEPRDKAGLPLGEGAVIYGDSPAGDLLDKVTRGDGREKLWGEVHDFITF